MKKTDKWAALNEFADHHAGNVGLPAVAVWVQLFRHAGGDGTVTLSQRRIAKACHISRATVQRAMDSLVANGLVIVEQPGNQHNGIAVLRITRAPWPNSESTPGSPQEPPPARRESHPWPTARATGGSPQEPGWPTGGSPQEPRVAPRMMPYTEQKYTEGITADAARAAAVMPNTGDSQESHLPDDDVSDPWALFYDDDEARRLRSGYADEPEPPGTDDGLAVPF